MLNLSSDKIDKAVPHHQLYVLRTLQSPRAGKVLAKWLLGIGILFFIVLFLPWQQNIRGTGKVTAFNPQNRPQSVEAVIAGRIKKWYVQEGQFVNKGDTIVTITEVKEKYFDPKLLQRMREQIAAKESSLTSKEEKTKALRRQIAALKETMGFKIDQTAAKVEAEKIRFTNAENQFQRNKKLFDAGNVALTKFQEIEYKYQGAKADLLQAQVEMDRVRAEYLDKISKAESEVSSTYAELYDTQADVAKLKNEFANLRIRNEQYQIVAPQSGFVVKAMQAGIAETLKEGDAVCTIMPEASDIAVEMYVKAMDVPLITKGREVRIQFDGWPALQFSGWPSVSVGSFGGLVKVIDYVNSKPGEFRILVIPNQSDEPWPKQLRVGSGIKGWIMLNDVPVWYEIWRQLNGLPPSFYEEPPPEVIESQSKAADAKVEEKK
jgi:multidrug resistance efflux pump